MVLMVSGKYPVGRKGSAETEFGDEVMTAKQL